VLHESATVYKPVVHRYANFAIGLDSKFFRKLHIQFESENLKLWTPISKFETAHSPANLRKYLVVSILPHEANVVAILPLVRHDWLKW